MVQILCCLLSNKWPWTPKGSSGHRKQERRDSNECPGTIQTAMREEDNKHLKEKPPSYVQLKRNRFSGKRKLTSLEEPSVCLCTTNTGCREHCLNRLLNIECTKGHCPAGDACENQTIQTRRSPATRWLPNQLLGISWPALQALKRSCQNSSGWLPEKTGQPFLLVELEQSKQILLCRLQQKFRSCKHTEAMHAGFRRSATGDGACLLQQTSRLALSSSSTQVGQLPALKIGKSPK